MASFLDLLASAPSHDHLVQFYTDAALVTASVSAYLAAGLKSGQTVLTIATAAHTRSFDEALAARGVDVQAAKRSKRLIAADADEMMARFMVSGEPDWGRFEAAIGSVLSELQQRSSLATLRAYGEMVDLLWQRGKMSAALRLEAYWNRLLRPRGIPLLCAYKINVAADAEAVDVVMSVHSGPKPSDQWLSHCVERALEDSFGAEAPAVKRAVLAACPKLPWPQAAVAWAQEHRPAAGSKMAARARELFLQPPSGRFA